MLRNPLGGYIRRNRQVGVERIEGGQVIKHRLFSPYDSNCVTKKTALPDPTQLQYEAMACGGWSTQDVFYTPGGGSR